MIPGTWYMCCSYISSSKIYLIPANNVFLRRRCTLLVLLEEIDARLCLTRGGEGWTAGRKGI